MAHCATTPVTAGFLLPRSIPFPVLALVVCLALAGVGLAVLDDYGLGHDESPMRNIARSNIDYVKGKPVHLFESVERHDTATLKQFYGIVFELPLLLIEWGLQLEDSREIFLMRHLVMHLFFLVGGLFCGLLAYRMFGGRTLALLAMLLFLLHPRLYAHSFFNNKDVPFAVMFMIALFLTHRAFRRDTIGAFTLCGAVIGLAITMRPFGLMLLPAILAMRGLDWWTAGSGERAAVSARRRHLLVTSVAFTAAALLALYASWPVLWENPLRLLEAAANFSQSPLSHFTLLFGKLIRVDAAPAYYVPVWFMITGPPLTLLLGGIGAAVVCKRGLAYPGRIFHNGELRFSLFLLVCLALPVGAAIVLQSTVYNGWRHFYFLWAPFSLLTAAGLHWLTCKGANRRAAAFGAAGLGLACVLVAMVALHPHQQVYFNLLVDRETPGGLARRYEMDYWHVSHRQAFEYLWEQYPGAPLQVFGKRWHLKMLPQSKRKHFVMFRKRASGKRLADLSHDFFIANNRELWAGGLPTEPVVHRGQVYGSNLFSIVAPMLVWGTLRPDADTYRAAHQSLVAASKPLAQLDFDLHINGDALFYVKDACDPADVEARFFLHLIPVDKADLPAHRRKQGFDNRDFHFAWRGGHFDGRCMTQAPLPNYPIARIRTGQFVRGQGQIWKAEIAPVPGGE